MKNKMYFGAIIIASIIALSTFTPAVSAENLNEIKKVTIKTTIHKFFRQEEIVTEVLEEEAVMIMENLEQYQESLIKGDKQLIEKYESLIIDSGIFGKDHNIFSKKDSISALYEKYCLMTLKNPSILADENQLCFINAKGKGNLTFILDNLFNYFIASGALLLVLAVKLPPLLPIVAPASLILILGGAAGLFINHLIPFRVLFPQLGMNLTTGDCSINGLNGSQHFPAPLNATFSGFNGLTVNFYTTKDPSVFLLGFALKSVVF